MEECCEVQEAESEEAEEAEEALVNPEGPVASAAEPFSFDPRVQARTLRAAPLGNDRGDFLAADHYGPERRALVSTILQEPWS
jgi:hypothetical protein